MGSNLPPASDAEVIREMLFPNWLIVTVAVWGSLLALCVDQWANGRSALTEMHVFVAVLGPFFALAWLAGLWFDSLSGRWFCIAWALLAAYLFLDAQMEMDHAVARGGFRCGNDILPAMFWTMALPPAMLFLAYRSAKRRKESQAGATTESPE